MFYNSDQEVKTEIVEQQAVVENITKESKGYAIFALTNIKKIFNFIIKHLFTIVNIFIIIPMVVILSLIVVAYIGEKDLNGVYQTNMVFPGSKQAAINVIILTTILIFSCLLLLFVFTKKKLYFISFINMLFALIIFSLFISSGSSLANGTNGYKGVLPIYSHFLYSSSGAKDLASIKIIVGMSQGFIIFPILGMLASIQGYFWK